MRKPTVMPMNRVDVAITTNRQIQTMGAFLCSPFYSQVATILSLYALSLNEETVLKLNRNVLL